MRNKLGFWSYDLEVIRNKIVELVKSGISIDDIKYNTIVESRDNPYYKPWNAYDFYGPLKNILNYKHIIFWCNNAK